MSAIKSIPRSFGLRTHLRKLNLFFSERWECDMRTTIEVIDELQREAEGALACFLAVSFKSTTLFVASNEPDALRKLNGIVEMGGHPVGLIRMVRGRPQELRIEVRSLDESKNDSDVESYLQRLAEEFIQNADAFGITPLN